MHHSDALIGQFEILVQCDDRRIIPLGDLAQVDVGQCGSIQFQCSRINPVHIDDRNHAADHRRELHQAILFQIFGLERHIGCAKVHGVGFNLFDAAAGTD